MRRHADPGFADECEAAHVCTGHGEALVRGLPDGRIDGIATDHSPHGRDEKMQANTWQAVSDFAGVETHWRRTGRDDRARQIVKRNDEMVGPPRGRMVRL
jgi:hypothetical protein